MPERRYDTLIEDASSMMLGKNHPHGREEWAKVINFIAWNVDFRTCLHVCSSIARSNEAPLTQKEIEDIVDFQTYRRAAHELIRQEQLAWALGDRAIRLADDYLADGFKEIWNRKGRMDDVEPQG
jgi:hypothetical protein